MTELTLKHIGGRVQELVHTRHGKLRWKRNRHALIIEAARLNVAAIEHGRDMFGGADAQSTIRSIAQVMAPTGNHHHLQGISYLTAACDPDPRLLEQIVAEDNPKMPMFVFLCNSILHTLMLHTHHGGPAAASAFAEISGETR